MEKLLSLQKFQVLTAKKGTDAIKILKQVPDIKLAIIDCYMDQQAGVKLTAEIRTRYNASELEIIGVSSYGGGAISAQFIKSGASDFLLKPFAPEEFLCRINSSIESLESTQELKRINELKNQFLGIAAHDIRGPVGSIETACSYILNKEDSISDKTKHLLEIMQNSSREVVDMLSDILDVSAIESGKLNLHLQPCNLNEIVQDRIELYSTSCNEKCITVHYESDSENIDISLDPIKIKQLIDNLITNAIKYTPKGGEILIKLHKGKHAEVFIEDSGPGIPSKELVKIYDPYTVSSVKSTGGEKQYGLGLNIAKKIADAHKGNIAYSKSQRLGGACFKLSFPIQVSTAK